MVIKMDERQNYYFLGNEDPKRPETKIEAEPEKISKKEMRKKQMRFYSMLFRVAAVLVLLLAVVCAIVFGYTDTSHHRGGKKMLLYGSLCKLEI